MMTTRMILGLASVLALTTTPLGAQQMETISVSRAVSGEEEVDVRVKFGAGELFLKPGSRGTLYAMDLRYDSRTFEPINEFDGRRLELGLEGRGRNINLDDDDEVGRIELELAPGIPMDLRLEFGAGRGKIDLGGLALRDLDIETGASDTRIDVTRPNPERLRRVDLDVGAAEFTALRLGNLNPEQISVNAGVGDITLDLTGSLEHDVRLDVDLGLGAIEIRVPEGVGVRVEKSSFLTSLEADDFIKRDGVYYSPEWQEASRRIEVEIDAAFGSIEIVRVRR
jgi:hypothetical protein